MLLTIVACLLIAGAAIWLVMTGRWPSKVLGVAIYLPYSVIYFLVVLPTLEAAGPQPVRQFSLIAINVITIVPILLGVFGLPRRPAAPEEAVAGAPGYARRRL